VRSAREVKTGSGGYPGVAWSLTGSIWPQAATETQLLFGEVAVTYPDACGVSGTNTPFGTISVSVDGQSIAYAYAYFYPGSEGRSQTIGLYFSPSNAIIGPDSGLTHVITARVLDSCTGTGQEFTFDALKIDVVGMS
jgi:hypothetical protein